MTASDATAKLFSVEQANQTLPLVKLIVRDIAALHSDLHSRRERLNDLTARRKPRLVRADDDPYADELRQMEVEFADDERRLAELIDELHQLGVQIDDAAAGSVVFPGRHGATLVWQLGAPNVRMAAADHTLNLYVPPESLQDSDGLTGGLC